MPKSATNPAPQGLLPSALRDLKAVVAAVITRDGELRDANAGFRSLLAGSDRDVRSLFLSPRFDQLAARRGDASDGAIYRGLLTLGDDRSARSLTGEVYATEGDELCLIAEPDVAQLESSVASLQAVNDQLAEALRVQALEPLGFETAPAGAAGIPAAVLDQLPVGVGVIDADGEVTLSNLRWRHYVSGSIPSRDAEAQKHWRIMDDEGRSIPPERWPGARALRGESSRADVLHVRDDGRKVWARLRAAPVRGEGGRIIGAIATIEDVDRRRGDRVGLLDMLRRLRTLVETMPNLIVVTDREGRIVHFNRACEELTGYRREELLGRTLTEALLPSAWRGIVERRFADPDLEALRRPHENPWRTKEGEERLIEWRCVTLPEEEREHGWFLLGIGIDVTERRETEKESVRLASIVSSSEDAIISESLDGTIQTWNAAAERIYGYRREEALGRNIRLIVPRDRLDEVARFQTRIAQGEQVEHFETVHRRKDGREIDVSLSLSPLWDREYRVVGVSAIARDLSESNRVERLLRKNTELMSAILASTTEAIVTIDRHGVIQSVNAATESMFGFGRKELIGSNVSLLMPSPLSDEHDGYLARYRETGEARIIGNVRELVARRKDGTMVPIELAVTDLADVGLFAGVVRDMSERTELQRHVLESATEEQRRIGRDLHDVTGNELGGLSLLATALVESLDQTTTEGPGQQVMEAADSSRIARMARQLADGLVVTHRHVRELSHGLVPAMVDAEDFGASLETLAAETDALDHISCRLEYAERIDLPDAATGTHLYRIAQEAVSNALQHGRPRRIWISLSRLDGRILLEVRDDGVGFDSAAARRSTAGMGLRTMSYRAGMIGASLDVETEKQGGTRVRCLLL